MASITAAGGRPPGRLQCGTEEARTMTQTRPPVLWTPSEERKERANITAFARWVRENRGVDAPEGDYEALWRWSTTDLDGFWAAIWEIGRASCRESGEVGVAAASC